jgi:hypothetical protein
MEEKMTNSINKGRCSEKKDSISKGIISIRAARRNLNLFCFNNS